MSQKYIKNSGHDIADHFDDFLGMVYRGDANG